MWSEALDCLHYGMDGGIRSWSLCAWSRVLACYTAAFSFLAPSCLQRWYVFETDARGGTYVKVVTGVDHHTVF